MAITHEHTAIANEIIQSAFWNANHIGTITDAQHGIRTLANAHAHNHLSGIGANDHHAQLHNAASHTDIASTGAQIDDAVTKAHTQNTDTALGAGAEAADHGAAATDQIINVSYGVGAPPAANTTTEGSLFVKYTA